MIALTPDVFVLRRPAIEHIQAELVHKIRGGSLKVAAAQQLKHTQSYKSSQDIRDGAGGIALLVTAFPFDFNALGRAPATRNVA